MDPWEEAEVIPEDRLEEVEAIQDILVDLEAIPVEMVATGRVRLVDLEAIPAIPEVRANTQDIQQAGRPTTTILGNEMQIRGDVLLQANPALRVLHKL